MLGPILREQMTAHFKECVILYEDNNNITMLTCIGETAHYEISCAGSAD